MFNRLRDAQRDYIAGGGNFVAFEFWSDKYGRGGVWQVNIEGVFDLAELRHLSNLLKNPTSKSLTNRYKVQKELFND